jgi:hypothetical protein
MELHDFVGELNLEESAGLQVEVAIAAYHDVLTFPTLPDLVTADTNAEYVDLGNAVFVMKPGKAFKKFEGSLEKNAFNSTLGGPRGAKSFINTLTVIRNAVNKHLTGWLRSNRNRPLIVAFRPLGETQYIFLGYQGLWAEVDEATLDVPGEIQGEKMTSFTVRSIYYPPFYIDAVPFTPAAEEEG